MLRFSCLIFLLLILSAAQEAWACRCNDAEHRAAPFNEAFDKAAVVFEGEVIQMTAKFCPKQDSKGTTVDGKTLIISGSCIGDIIQREIDPKTETESFSRYQIVLNVQNVWKDKYEDIKNYKITVETFGAGGWCGFQFEKGQKYLVYGRKDKNDQGLPVVSLCSRTRPLIYATDDLQWLKERATQKSGNRS